MQVERIRRNSKTRFWYNTSLCTRHLSIPPNALTHTYNRYMFFFWRLFIDDVRPPTLQRCASRTIPSLGGSCHRNSINHPHTNEMRPTLPTKRIIHVNRKIIPLYAAYTYACVRRRVDRSARVTSSGRRTQVVSFILAAVVTELKRLISSWAFVYIKSV